MILDQTQIDLIKSFLRLNLENRGIQVEKINHKSYEDDNILFRINLRFQVTHQTKESSGIEWRYFPLNISFSKMGLFRGISDKVFDSLFNFIDSKINDIEPKFQISTSLDKKRNEEFVPRYGRV